MQRIHDDGGTQPCAQWLFAPMLDDRAAAHHELDAHEHFVWNSRQHREGWSGDLGAPAGSAEVHLYSVPARRQNLTGLPPAYLTWTDLELFADEDSACADALRAAGVPVTTDVVPGGVHGFESWAKDTPVARELVERAQAWLRSATVAQESLDPHVPH